MTIHSMREVEWHPRTMHVLQVDASLTPQRYHEYTYITFKVIVPRITLLSKSQEILLVTQCEPTLRIE